VASGWAGSGGNMDKEAFGAAAGKESEEGDAACRRELRWLKGGVERSELTWRPAIWDPMPHQQKPPTTAHESSEGG
jgi:hypothetical protein